MTKENAGERKRTVTVVVGPETEALMDRLNAALAARHPWAERQTLTSLVGVSLNEALSEWRATELNDGPKQAWSHFD